MTLSVLFVLLFAHWFADFVQQSNEDAQNKSTCFGHLLSHVINYGLWLTVATCDLVFFKLIDPWLFCLFILIQTISHLGIDYITSKLNSVLWKQSRVHDFFVSVGLDQMLHYFILFGSWYLLAN